jgi:predicted DNA-binding protein
MDTERIQVRVPSKLYRQLQALAKDDKRDLSTYVRLLIEDTLLQKQVNHEGK